MLIELLPYIYRRFDESAGGQLFMLFSAFDATIADCKGEIEKFPDLVDIDEVEDRFLPYLLRNIANPFPTDALSEASDLKERWVIGITNYGRIDENYAFEEINLTADALRELARQLFQLYKRKGTKQGILWACRAVAMAEVFIADWFTDSAASLRSGYDNDWVLGGTQFGMIQDSSLAGDAPHCLLCEGFGGDAPYPESYGVPTAETNSVSAECDFIERFYIYQGIIVFDINIEAIRTDKKYKLLFQYSEDGGFTWKKASGWLCNTITTKSRWWILGETNYGEIVDKITVESMAEDIAPGSYCFIFTPAYSGVSETGLRYFKLRVLPFDSNLLGAGAITDPFKYANGENPQEDSLIPESIPAILSDLSYRRQRWILGRSAMGIIGEINNSEKKRYAECHFEVIIISRTNALQKKLIRAAVEYMKPAQTHWTLIEGEEQKSASLLWRLGESNYGIINN